MAEFCKYLYLDSKIVGTAKQIAVYFEQGIFQREDTLVLIKKYKHKSAKEISKVFRQDGLKYRFIKMGDLDLLEKGVIFYPFNAQSNVRAVANRKLKHIFITHGESNKAASVKPIIRIYDYVVTAGQVGINRFLDNGIFTQHDVDCGRLITMGDTFVGKTGLNEKNTGKPCIFYAPTWEGGIEQENYSSLANVDLVAKTLKALADEYCTPQIVIRPHPNTGHRLPIYYQNLLRLVEELSAIGLKIAIFRQNFTVSLVLKWKFRRLGIAFIDELNLFSAKFGLCDISAMETQLLNEDIPYYLYWNYNKHPDVIVDKSLYEASRFSEEKQAFFQITCNTFKHSLIDQSFSSVPLNERINYLMRSKGLL